MRLNHLLSFVKNHLSTSHRQFHDRLFFQFGYAGIGVSIVALVAAIVSGLPVIAVISSAITAAVIILTMVISSFLVDITVPRMILGFLINFIIFPWLFFVAGGTNCGMQLYFVMGISFAMLAFEGKLRLITLIATIAVDSVCIYIGFRYPALFNEISPDTATIDTIVSFILASTFICLVIGILKREHQHEHMAVEKRVESFKQQAITDGLTTLYNHRYLYELLQKIVKSCHNDSNIASIIMLDIDDFKHTNDTYGHLRGNQALCQFATLLKKHTPPNCSVARYGGEEFVIVMPNYTLSQAAFLAEEIRTASCDDLILQELSGSSFSISGGVAEYDKGETVSEWVERADVNMYAAKEKGKNNIVI